MHKKEKVKKSLLEQKLLPLYYHDSSEVSCEILYALYKGGVRIVEYTNRGEAALKNFEQLRDTVDNIMPGLLLGIGTVKSKNQAKDYIKAGADFIVAPSVNEEVGKICEEEELFWIPGCMTPTEIAVAENAGATVIKIFPGSLLGTSYIIAIKDLFPGLQFLVTGGVEAEANNLKAWFSAGIGGVGMGSRLISKEMIEQKNYEGIKNATANALALVKHITTSA